MLDYEAFDTAIATRLAPVREALAGIPVAALPKEAGKFGSDQFESVDWLFPDYQGIPRESKRHSQDVRMTLLIRLAFNDRYSDDPNFTRAMDWVEQQVLGLLVYHRLPGANTDLEVEGGRSFAPVAGRWVKEIRFTFETTIVPIEVPAEPTPLVKLVRNTDSVGVLAEVEK